MKSVIFLGNQANSKQPFYPVMSHLSLRFWTRTFSVIDDIQQRFLSLVNNVPLQNSMIVWYLYELMINFFFVSNNKTKVPEWKTLTFLTDRSCPQKHWLSHWNWRYTFTSDQRICMNISFPILDTKQPRIQAILAKNIDWYALPSFNFENFHCFGYHFEKLIKTKNPVKQSG